MRRRRYATGHWANPQRRILLQTNQKNIALRAYFLGLAGDEGFEPPNGGTRTHCLTTWRIPNGLFGLSYFSTKFEKKQSPGHRRPGPKVN